jgi:hypothetical protein
VTVSLDFEVDERSLQGARSRDPGHADVVLLRNTYFDMPVHFNIGNVKLIDVEMPLYAVAVEGLEDLKKLPTEQRLTMSLPVISGLDLEMEDDEVVITNPVRGGGTVRVSYDELLAAWEAFAEKVRVFLVSKFPELREHPQVGAWFRGEE